MCVCWWRSHLPLDVSQQAAGSQAKQVRAEPLIAQLLFDQSEPHQGLLSGPDTSCRLEANLREGKHKVGSHPKLKCHSFSTKCLLNSKQCMILTLLTVLECNCTVRSMQLLQKRTTVKKQYLFPKLLYLVASTQEVFTDGSGHYYGNGVRSIDSLLSCRCLDEV